MNTDDDKLRLAGSGLKSRVNTQTTTPDDDATRFANHIAGFYDLGDVLGERCAEFAKEYDLNMNETLLLALIGLHFRLGHLDNGRVIITARDVKVHAGTLEAACFASGLTDSLEHLLLNLGQLDDISP